MKNIKLNQGFTLIELLVVVVIIAILGAIALPRYQFAVEKTRAAERLSVAKTIAMAQEQYKLATGTFAKEMDLLPVSMPVEFDKQKNLQILISNSRNEVEVKHNVTSGTSPYYKIYVQMESVGYIPFKKGAMTCAVVGAKKSDIAQKICDSLCNNSPYTTVSGEPRCLINYIFGDPS